MMIADLMGKSNLVKLGALSRSPHDPLHVEADVSRLRNEVGWKPMYDLRCGLKHTIDWWKKNYQSRC